MFARDLFDGNSVGDVLGWRVTLIKVQPGQVLEVRFFPRIIQSLHFHYIGRALPCSGEDCPACFAGVGSRQVFYLSCSDPRDTRHYGLVEIGDSSMSSLLDLSRNIPTDTDWLAAKLTRTAKNKPVRVLDLSIAADQRGKLTPQLVMMMLARLYELPIPTSDHGDSWRHLIKFTLEQRLKRAVATL